jgi:hypothetical protein
MSHQQADERCYIRVRWSEYKGYVIMQNPLDGKIYIVEAKGLPKWVFERLKTPGEQNASPVGDRQ